MTTHVNEPLSGNIGASSSTSPRKLELGLLAAGLLAMYIPTYVALDETIWNLVGQGHGPVMLALTLWLIYQRWPTWIALPDRPATVPGGVILLCGLLVYLLGRSQDVLYLDTASQMLVLAGLCLLYKGFPGLKVMAFPLLFLITIVPLPASFVDQITGPLKSGVSHVSENLMHLLGYPIGRSGVMLTIGQYQLLVADACAGLNSVFALEAIGIFYMSVVQHTRKIRNVLLALLILPISFVSNVVRVISLVLITYYFGDEVGQGFVHDFAGILLFMVATALTIGVDSLLGIFLPEKSKS